MTLQQLRSIQEVVKCNFNISAAARALNNTPPNVSRYLRMLEDELSVRMFCRVGGKLTGMTPEGTAIMQLVDAVLDNVDGLQRLAQGMQRTSDGVLTVGSVDICLAHTLPAVIARFKQQHSAVAVNMLRGSVQEIVRLTAEGMTDFSLVSGDVAQFGDLVALPYARHELSVVMSQEHPLGQEKQLSLRALMDYPLATYVPGHAGRVRVDEAFSAAGITPDIAYASNDSELLKGMVRSSNVVGLLCGGGHGNADGDLKVRSAAQLFAPITAYVCLRRDSAMRRHGYDFIAMLAPHLSYDKVIQAFTLRQPEQMTALLGTPPLVTPGPVASTPVLRTTPAVHRTDGNFACRSIAGY